MSWQEQYKDNVNARTIQGQCQGKDNVEASTIQGHHKKIMLKQAMARQDIDN
jgi:hypothetical protein